MTPNQRAQLARKIETARLEHAHQERLERAENAGRRALDARYLAELELAEKLLGGLCLDSPIDLADHALGIARTILNARRKDRP